MSVSRPLRRSRLLVGLACWILLPAAISQAVSFHSTPIDVTPDGEELWVCNPDHGTVGVIDVMDAGINTLIAEITVGAEPWCLDIHPSNGEVWVTSMGNHRVYVLDATTKTVIDSIDAGFETFGVAFDPAGNNALVTASGSDEIFVIDVSTRMVTATFDVYRRPRGIAWKADGSRAWVTHLLMPENSLPFTVVTPGPWSTEEKTLSQVFGLDRAGYPSTVQSLAVAPAPHDSLLWIPNNMINTTTGQLIGNPLTPTNIFHATIRPYNHETETDLWTSTYFLNDGTPVGGPIAVDFKGTKAFVANLHSENVSVLGIDILNPTEIAVLPAGMGPIGVVTHHSEPRAFVANWLSRDVTVIGTVVPQNITTVPSTFGPEPLLADQLNGKQFFFTSLRGMSLDGRGSCASCHVFGTHDGRPWDLSQFGKFKRSTPDCRGIGFTGAHDWTADKDEMQDHDFGVLEFTGGIGLLQGSANPPLGAPNAGIDPDLDDLAVYMTLLEHRPRTPFLLPNGDQTAAADSGEVLFHDGTVGCATCHVPPFYTDSSLLSNPFVKHDVGTADVQDADAAAGFDTPSLVGAWDTGRYLHNAFAATIEDVIGPAFNPGDLHGTTSHLSPEQIGFIADFVRSIGWPDSTGSPTGIARFEPRPLASLQQPFPNPFANETSLRFAADRRSRVRIEVMDVRGRRVRTLFDRDVTRGNHVVGWDSRADDGSRVAPGVYFARLSIDGIDSGGRKLTVVR